MTEAQLEQLKAVSERLTALRNEVQGSLALRATGGAHIINELFQLEPELKALVDAVQADVEVHA